MMQQVKREEMRAMIKRSWKFLLVIPVFSTLLSCAHSPYVSDNKRRMKHLEVARTKYDAPGQSRVKTGHMNDGF
jgi:hypothetical protein